ncbi:MAG: hypothetical protein ACP5OG_01730 [Candidatus Nanoarchaeia archaeon]
MIIIKILGIIDILIAMIFWVFGVFGIIPSNFILLIGIALLAKGIIFVTGLSFASILDIVCSVLIIAASSIHMPKIIIVIVSLFLLQKGLFSLAS